MNSGILLKMGIYTDWRIGIYTHFLCEADAFFCEAGAWRTGLVLSGDVSVAANRWCCCRKDIVVGVFGNDTCSYEAHFFG